MLRGRTSCPTPLPVKHCGKGENRTRQRCPQPGPNWDALAECLVMSCPARPAPADSTALPLAPWQPSWSTARPHNARQELQMKISSTMTGDRLQLGHDPLRKKAVERGSVTRPGHERAIGKPYRSPSEQPERRKLFRSEAFAADPAGNPRGDRTPASTAPPDGNQCSPSTPPAHWPAHRGAWLGRDALTPASPHRLARTPRKSLAGQERLWISGSSDAILGRMAAL